MRCVIKWLVSRHGGGVTFLILEMAGWHLKRDAPFFYRRSDLGVQGQLELDRSSMVRGPAHCSCLIAGLSRSNTSTSCSSIVLLLIKCRRVHDPLSPGTPTHTARSLTNIITDTQRGPHYQTAEQLSRFGLECWTRGRETRQW